MSDGVQLTRDGTVAIITIHNAPVNALTPEVVGELSAAIGNIDADSAITAAVLIGAGRTFVAGADIREFVRVTSGEKQRIPLLLALARQIEDIRKPVVAAIHGEAFGGGMELAMAAHYRVSTPEAQFGQLEVKLGLIPGAGGTQRLPRLAGVPKALDMCTSGGPIGAREALELGIIDRVVDGELLSEALEFARQVTGAPMVKTRERNSKLSAFRSDPSLFATARENAGKKQRGMRAPLAAIAAVEAATQLPFDEACELEQKLFNECLFSDECKALIHLFFAERELAKIPDVPKGTSTLPTDTAGVIGAGTMGSGIAMALANAGIPVLLKDIDGAALQRGLATIQENYRRSVERGRITKRFADERLALIAPALSYDRFSAVDLVIEAAFENMAIKKVTFGELDTYCKPGAILASNTSSLNIDEIAAATSRPESVIGLHFFSPANVMRLVEIVRGKKTSAEVIATSLRLAKKLHKVGVVVGNCRGFVGNRMFHQYRREAQFLVEEGASIEGVDKALYDFGMAMGPLATADLAGLDVGWRIRKEHRHLDQPGVRQSIAEDRLCEIGRFGQKTRMGWYRYDERRRASLDPIVSQLIQEWAREAGIPQREISKEEIVERCIYSMINEGARILEEGYALRPGDIDIIYINGYGFPSYRGGPMWYADRIGLSEIYGRVCEFHQQHGKWWEPAPLLKKLAQQGGKFADFVGVAGATA
jgi:3-hydroxyacyl-CoA dehydrogenase